MKHSKVLLHICCGVCAASVVLQLRKEGIEVKGFFYNPNIHPLEEYTRRLKTTQEVSQLLRFPLIEGQYAQDRWHKRIQGLEGEPEGGKRCAVCFQMRLEETYSMSRKMNIPLFTTTLTVSSHKDASIINRLGRHLNEKGFLGRDFKKRDGFKEAIIFAKRHNLYRQNYCGCIYSKSSMG